MKAPEDFDFWVDEDRLHVRFVSIRRLGRLPSGHSVWGDYTGKVIRLPRYEHSEAQKGIFFHELGHYLAERQELCTRATIEDVCDLLTWLPSVLLDRRNAALRRFLGLALPARRGRARKQKK